MATFDIPAEVMTRFSWEYDPRRPALTKLYEKGKRSMWIVDEDIDFTKPVDFGSPLPLRGGERTNGPMSRRSEADQNLFRWEVQAWMVSQFLHGEQGALVASARLIETLPDIDAKFYAAEQAFDEARHVEAYSKYLNNKLGRTYPIATSLASLLTDVMTEKNWDITYLGMQIMIEGLALASFGLASVMFHDDVIKQITDYVKRDEARHVSFGIIALSGVFSEMTNRERSEREDFVIEASQLMRDRFLMDEVWERFEIPAAEGREFALTNPNMTLFRAMLFSKIVPNLNKLGLLTPRVRTHFEKLDILQFENDPDDLLGDAELGFA
jgi:hypothetical protein